MAAPGKSPLYLRVRLPVQILALIAWNALFLFDLRAVTAPALNCWASPTASFACPMGALQNSMPALRATVLAPIYILGSIFLFCAIMGRSMCGWLCPFGLVQDLFGGIRRRPWRLPRWTGYFKYLVLISLGLVIPYLTFEPMFCKLCPQGALQGGIFQPLLDPELRQFIGTLYYVKLGILAAFILGSVFIRRPFCHSFCALGAIFSLFGRIGFIRIRYHREKCVDCLWCVRACPAGIDPRTDLQGMNCVSCMECAKCPFDAIKVGIAPACKRCAEDETAGEVEHG